MEAVFFLMPNTRGRMTNIFKRKKGKPNAFPYGKRVILRPFHRRGKGKPNAFP